LIRLRRRSEAGSGTRGDRDRRIMGRLPERAGSSGANLTPSPESEQDSFALRGGRSACKSYRPAIPVASFGTESTGTFQATPWARPLGAGDPARQGPRKSQYPPRRSSGRHQPLCRSHAALSSSWVYVGGIGTLLHPARMVAAIKTRAINLARTSTIRFSTRRICHFEPRGQCAYTVCPATLH
jgi:hypothetical protein